MSLIESAQHAPLASEEKSLDKLEIEMEEKEQMIKDPATAPLEVKASAELKIDSEIQKETDEKENVPEVEVTENNKEKDGKKSSKDKEDKIGGDEKTPKRPKLNIKIPQILRKKSKERPTDKNKEKSGEERDPLQNGDGKEVIVEIVEIPLISPEVENAENETLRDKKAKKEKSETSGPGLAESSFLAAFSTPKWANFRRVFNFNRSTPAPMAMCEVDATKGDELQVVDLDITAIDECEVDGEKKKLNDDGLNGDEKDEKIKTEEQNGTDKPTITNPILSTGNILLAPIVKLFRNRRAPKRTEGKDVDVESGVVTELLDKNKPNDGNGVEKPSPDKKSEGMNDKTDGKENKSELGVDGNSDNKEKKGDSNKEEKSDTPTNKIQVWRQRITELPKFSKVWIMAGICTLLVLLTIVVSIAVLRACRAIDIGTLIVDGKYINTITSCGHIQGVIEDDGFAFRGIPYAIPPVGELRWRPAKTHSHLDHCWNGTYLAHNYSTACWQFYRNGSYDGSEDCLYLDVYTPKVYYDTPLPIVVFIGGETLNGGQSSTLQPSAKLAREKNVVFVSVSIRRSVLGFLALDMLSRSTYPISSGNYGLSDLLAALQWVRYNSEHFGGDRNSVTIFGHQSGSSLATSLMRSHQSKGLFHRIWISGGSPLTTLLSFQDAEKQNRKFLSEVGCTSIECLYNKSPEELLESVPYDWRSFHQDLPTKNEDRHHWLVRDGQIIREPVNKINYVNEVAFVVGAPSEVDASPEMYSYLDWNDTKKFSAYLESKFGSFGPSLSREVADRYFRPESTSWQQFSSLLSDLRTICPLYYSSTSFSTEFEQIRVNFYVATQRKQTSIGFVADSNSDISAIFGLYKPVTSEEKKFVENMNKMFYGFVEKGELLDNSGDIAKSIYIVNENIEKMFVYPNCDFWNQNGFLNYSRID